MNLAGMLLAIIGAAALVGLTLGKALVTPQQSFTTDAKNLINPLDLLIIQANTNTITAHFSGIVSSLLLLNKIS